MPPAIPPILTGRIVFWSSGKKTSDMIIFPYDWADSTKSLQNSKEEIHQLHRVKVVRVVVTSSIQQVGNYICDRMSCLQQDSDYEWHQLSYETDSTNSSRCASPIQLLLTISTNWDLGVGGGEGDGVRLERGSLSSSSL